MPRRPTSTTAWALPNKFFDYMQARLGIMIGPVPRRWRASSRRRGLGAVAGGFDAAAVTKVLDAMTTEQVQIWKAHAALQGAMALSSESQVEVWGAAIDALAEQARA